MPRSDWLLPQCQAFCSECQFRSVATRLVARATSKDIVYTNRRFGETSVVTDRQGKRRRARGHRGRGDRMDCRLGDALPRESVELFNDGIKGQTGAVFELYRWFLPLLRMDTVPNFVQLIKLVQEEVGIGNSRVRPPRLELMGNELEQARKMIRDALRTRPQSVASYALPNGE